MRKKERGRVNRERERERERKRERERERERERMRKRIDHYQSLGAKQIFHILSPTRRRIEASSQETHLLRRTLTPAPLTHSPHKMPWKNEEAGKFTSKVQDKIIHIILKPFLSQTHWLSGWLLSYTKTQ